MKTACISCESPPVPALIPTKATNQRFHLSYHCKFILYKSKSIAKPNMQLRGQLKVNSADLHELFISELQFLGTR